MRENIDRLYDGIADHYDQDLFGLLSGPRELAIEQITARVASQPRLRVVDLGAGTGESLGRLAPRLSHPTCFACDVSAEMLARAKKKCEVVTICDDATRVDSLFEWESVDLVLMHFLTTFIDVARTMRAVSRVLRPGGYLSVVSTTADAFGRLQDKVGSQIATVEELRRASPAPENVATLTRVLRDTGLEVVESTVVVRPIVFSSFEQSLDFGVKSGFFTHIIEALGAERVNRVATLSGVFPIEDEHRAVVILARKAGSRS